MDIRLLIALAATGLVTGACHAQQPLLAAASPLTRTAAQAQAPQPARYVGRWAASAAQCGQRAWIFTSDAMHGPDGMNCDILGANTTRAGGYSASSQCAAGGKRKAARLTMSFNGPDSLRLTDGPFPGPITLSRCAASPA